MAMRMTQYQQRNFWLSRMPERVPAHQVVPTLQAAPAFLADLILADSDKDEDDRSTVDETPLMQGRPLEPVIQEVMLSTQDAPAYDRQALAQVLASSTQKELRTDPVFIHACRDAYRRRGTYRAVIQEFWGSYSGSREETVKAALSYTEPQPTRPREMASAA
jgi:hypothetical protein